MNLVVTPGHIAIALLASSLIALACSSPSNTPSSDGANDAASDGMTGSQDGDDTTGSTAVNDGSAADTEGDASTDTDTNADTGTDADTDTGATGVVSDPVAVDPTDSPPVVPDPLLQNTTRIDFDIEVPPYQSDALQVELTWGDRTFTAEWIGDEVWSASAVFPTDTENELTVTFLDDNGDLTLGSFTEPLTTGTNTAESYPISADDFDTGRWDDDGDSISNLDELLAGTDPRASAHVLLFSETRGFRHDSIADALDALDDLAASVGIQTTRAGDSAGHFTDANLATYDAVVWVLTSGDVLNDDEQAAFERYIGTGGGYAGIHAASDTEYEWPWYGGLVGAYFESHPSVQAARQTIEDGSHASTAHLSTSWTRTDEWYDYSRNPRADVNVLLTLDEDSYTGGGMGDDHPSAWYHVYQGGRSWYTGGGHTRDSYAEPDFRAHLLGGLRYAVGQD